MTTETFIPVPGKTYQGPMMPQFILTKEITVGAKIMYAILCDCAAYYKADSCYPSHKTLAEKLSCSVSSVKRYLKELTSAELIRIEFREQTSNIYYMLKHDALAEGGNVASDAAESAPQPQTVLCDEETVRQQVNVGQPQFKVNHAQSKVDYASNLNKQQEEEKNPPLPPAPVTQNVPPASRPVGGEGSFFSDFEKLWEAYPRKDAKDPAEQAYKRILRSRQCPPLPELLAAIKRFMVTTVWQRENGRFIPYLSNFLKDQRWLDPLSEEEEAANRKHLEAERLELARKREGEAEEARKKETRQRLRPIYDAFAEKFDPEARQTNERVDAMNFGTWMHHYGKYAGPTAADVPDGTTLSIKEFFDSYQRQRDAESWHAAHRTIAVARDSHPDNRERKPMNCAEIPQSGNFLTRFIPARQPVCAAV